MKYSNIQFTVQSAKQAHNICAICRKFYKSAEVTSIGYIGGYFHSAPAIIRCEHWNNESDKNAWGGLVSELIKLGFGDCIH